MHKIFFLVMFIFILGCATTADRLNQSGIDLAKENRLQEAIIQFEAAQKEDPQSLEIQLNLAKTYLLNNESEKALQTTQGIVKNNPNHFVARLLLSQAHWNLKQYEEAEKNLLDWIAQNNSQIPESQKESENLKTSSNNLNSEILLQTSAVYLALAEFSMYKKDWGKATLYAEKSVYLTPESDQAHFQLGRIYLQEEINKSSQRKPWEYPEANNRRSLMIQLGNIMATGGLQLDKARTEFRKTIYLNPQHSQAHIMLGMLAFHTGNYEEAELELSHAKANTPDNPYLDLALAATYQSLKKWDKALEYISAAEKVLIDTPEPQMLRAFLEIDRKNYSQAIKTILDISRQYPTAKESMMAVLRQSPEQHVPWLIEILQTTSTSDFQEFASDTLAYISNLPKSQDPQKWREWWKNHQKNLLKFYNQQ